MKEGSERESVSVVGSPLEIVSFVNAFVSSVYGPGVLLCTLVPRDTHLKNKRKKMATRR